MSFTFEDTVYHPRLCQQSIVLIGRLPSLVALLRLLQILLEFRNEMNTIMSTEIHNGQQDVQEAITKMMETSGFSD